MNKKAIGLVLIFGGAAIAAIAVVGNERVNESTDVERLQQAAWEQEQQREEDRDRALAAPGACVDVPLAAFRRVCDNEVDDDEEPIAWTTGLEPAQADCVAASYLQVDERNDLLQGREHDPDEPLVDLAVIMHACEVTGDLAMFVDGVDPAQPGLRADEALDAWHGYKRERGGRMSY